MKPNSYVFYRPDKILQIENILDQLYANPDRGKPFAIKGWGSKRKFIQISKEELLKVPPRSAITNFDNHGFKMNFFGDIKEEKKTKMIEHLSDSSTRWIGPYKMKKTYTIYSSNKRSALEFYGIVLSFKRNQIRFAHYNNTKNSWKKKFV